MTGRSRSHRPGPWRAGGGGRWRGPPPWWPEGERWPPSGPPWRSAPRRVRRRFLLAALTFLALLLGLGMVIGMLTGGWDDHAVEPGSESDESSRRPFALLWMVGGVMVIGGTATWIAYRRLSQPVGELLGAAERVAGGDYDVKVEPDGPRELRLLTTTFNDMAVRLASSDEQRRRFLADVTHELRTPLAVLQSGIEAQLDGIHPRDDRHLASLLEETERLGRLVDDLHTLALSDAGRLVLHLERCRPAALVEDAVGDHTALAGRKGVSIRMSVGEGVPEVEVDPVRFRQIVDNLLSNAVRHTPRGGEVEVRVDVDAARASDADDARDADVRAALAPEAGDSDVRVGAGRRAAPTAIRVTVSDGGPGFPAARLDRIFDRQARPAGPGSPAGSADTVGSGSSGLGLSIVHDLVSAHGGTIRAANLPGGGASVSFTIPLRN